LKFRGSSAGLCLLLALGAFEKFDVNSVKGGISAMVDNCCDTILVTVLWFGGYKEIVFVIVTIMGCFCVLVPAPGSSSYTEVTRGDAQQRYSTRAPSGTPPHKHAILWACIF
jgi:hypothetical protein